MMKAITNQLDYVSCHYGANYMENQIKVLSFNYIKG